MEAGDGEPTGDVLKRSRASAAEKFNRQYRRARRQDWWTFSKMMVVFSMGLVFVAALLLLVGSVVTSIGNVDIPLAVSVASLVLGLTGPTVFYLVAASALAGLAGAVSIATGNEEIIKMESRRNRYIVHVLKLIFAIVILFGFYQAAGGGSLIGFAEFLVILFGATGLLVLSAGLLLWGSIGLWKEHNRN